MQHGFPQRVGRVYLLVQALKLYASVGEVVQGVHHIAHAAAESV